GRPSILSLTASLGFFGITVCPSQESAPIAVAATRSTNESEMRLISRSLERSTPNNKYYVSLFALADKLKWQVSVRRLSEPGPAWSGRIRCNEARLRGCCASLSIPVLQTNQTRTGRAPTRPLSSAAKGLSHAEVDCRRNWRIPSIAQ